MSNPLDLRSRDQRFGFLVASRHVEQIVGFCLKADQRETGGILVGHYSQARDQAVVTSLPDPPADSTSGPTWFRRGVRGLSRLLEMTWKKDGHFYLGEWHYHPGASSEPSSRDNAQMSSIARDPAYACPEPVLLVVGGNRGSLHASASVYSNGHQISLVPRAAALDATAHATQDASLEPS